MKKHIDNIIINAGVLIFLLNLSEIIDMLMGDFYGSLYYWFIWLGGVLFIFGLVRKIEKNK